MQNTSAVPTEIKNPKGPLAFKLSVSLLFGIVVAVFLAVYLNASKTEPLTDAQILMETEGDLCVRQAIVNQLMNNHMVITRGDVMDMHRNCDNKTNVDGVKAKNEALVEQQIKALKR
jgi:hypothetical protein